MLLLCLLLVLVGLRRCSDYRLCRGRDRRNTIVKCDNAGIGGIPVNMPTAVQYLNIKNDDFGGWSDFPTLPRLKRLTLSKVNITWIPSKAFANLRSLTHLYIYGEDIEFIEEDAFHGLHQLTQLRLNNNNIKTLPEYMVKDSRRLTLIYLNYNKLTRILANTFQPLKNVLQLNLEDNEIVEIEEGAFRCLYNSPRSRLYVADNQLTTWKEGNWFDKINHVKIYGNPIVCDCTLVIPRHFTDSKAECSDSAHVGVKILSLRGTVLTCSTRCELPDIPNGFVEHTEPLTPGEFLSIGCNVGYELRVFPKVKCLDNGTYSQGVPTCTEERSDPEEQEDGTLVVISKHFAVYPNYITTNCPPNTVLKTCRCVEYYCSGVVIYDNSCVIVAAPEYPTKAYIICLKEDVVEAAYTFELTEDVTHTAACRNRYHITVCTAYIRDAVIGNHAVIEPDDESVCNVDCGEKECEMFVRCLIIIDKKQCEKFSISMATIHPPMTTNTKFAQGDVVTITCKEGYSVYGEDTVECVEGFQYIPEFLPQCEVEVPECTMEEMGHVSASPAWSVQQDYSITLSCEAGYQGDSVIIGCGEGGLWNLHQSITCTEQTTASCQVGVIVNANITLENGDIVQDYVIEEGEKIKYECEAGYEPTEPIFATCLSTGSLDIILPACKEIHSQGCTVPRIKHGRVEQFEAGFTIEPGTTITVVCDMGYELYDFAYLECISEQYYEPNYLPICIERDMSCAVPTLESGYYQGYRPGEFILNGWQLMGQCNTGYMLDGPSIIVCTEGSYNGQVNNCSEKLACEIPHLDNGRVVDNGNAFMPGVTLSVVCDNGYWSDYNEITCIEAANMYAPFEVPSCTLPDNGCARVAFPFMYPLVDATAMGDTVTVDCREGYTLLGSNILTCGTGNQYIGPFPQCISNSLCELPTIEFGGTDSEQGYVENGTMVQIECDAGYDVYGDTVVKCLGGIFSGILTPKCIPAQELERDCMLPYVDNGIFIANNLINPGSTLVLACNVGYEVEEEDNMIMCVTDSTFEPAELIQCVSTTEGGGNAQCARLNIEHGEFHGQDTTSVGVTAFITCNKGYTLVGEGTLMCMSGGLFGPTPRCEKEAVICPYPNITNGDVSPGTPIAEGSIYFIECHADYEIDGDDHITCLEGGVTQPPLEGHPICTKVKAPCQRMNIENGWMIEPHNNRLYAVGEVTHLICHASYEPRSFRTVCVGDGVFDPPIPPCTFTGIECVLPAVANGTIHPILSHYPPFKKITINCDTGFDISGDEEIMCLSTGEWEAQMPKCSKTSYPCDTPVITNGIIVGPNPLMTDDRFSLECNEGYQLVGTKFLSCFKGDKYSDMLPSCQKIDPDAAECRQISIQNGYTIGSRLAGHYAQAMCDEGYSIQGEKKLRCLATGKYDNPSPQCIKRDQQFDMDCGMRDPRYMDPKVFGGEDANPGEFPWNVLIEFTKGRFCGGSLINNEWVLTAGHCLSKSMYQECDRRCQLISPKDVLAIKGGVHTRSEDATHQWQIRTATELFVHPYFKMNTRYIDYDVGLIKVNATFTYDNSVNRICLPKQGVDDLVLNQHLFVTGWGKTSKSLQSSVLQKIDIPYVDREICNSNISYNGVITGTMFCAGYKMGKIDACQGDSGGPLVFLGSNGTFVQGGIVSWGKGCALENFYGVYTNLAYFYEWIMTYIKVN